MSCEAIAASLWRTEDVSFLFAAVGERSAGPQFFEKQVNGARDLIIMEIMALVGINDQIFRLFIWCIKYKYK